MKKVLLVEDEMLVRIGLKNSINWESFGMQVIDDVSNGQAAWDVYQKEKPDLILTDIKMPIMDGMQLITRIRENDTKTKIVILTVYEEFDLLHKCLHLGITNYIRKLKMSLNEMESVLAKIQAEFLAETSHFSAEAHDAKIDPMTLKENAVKDYLFYGRYSEAEFTIITQKLNFRLYPERLVLCVMAIDKFERMESKFKDQHGNLIRFSFLNIINELFSGYNRGEVLHEKDERYILLFSFQDMISEQQIYQVMQDIFSRINSVIKTYLDNSAIFGMSSIHNGYASLRRMYGEGSGALEQRYFLGKERYIKWTVIESERMVKQIGTKLENMITDLELFNSRYQKEMEIGVQKLLLLPSIVKTDIDIMFIRWIHWPTVNLSNYMDNISIMALDYAGRIHHSSTLDETIELFIEYYSQVQTIQSNKKRLSKEIAEAVKFIDENYHQEVSLQQVADHVQMSPNYLSNLFKKDLDLSFIEYLNHYRIGMAKNMLLYTKLKSYEIAEKVGYMDDSYFSRIFKKTTGMPPNEFRKQWFLESAEERLDKDGETII